jgi:hypothetical protein
VAVMLWKTLVCPYMCNPAPAGKGRTLEGQR